MFFLAEAVPSMDLGSLIGSMAGLGLLAILIILALFVGVILLNTIILWVLGKVLGFEKGGLLRAFGTVILNLVVGGIVGFLISIPFTLLNIPFIAMIINSIAGFIISIVLIKFIMGAGWIKAFIAAIALFIVGIIVGFVIAILLTVLVFSGMIGAMPFAMG